MLKVDANIRWPKAAVHKAPAFCPMRLLRQEAHWRCSSFPVVVNNVRVVASGHRRNRRTSPRPPVFSQTDVQTRPNEVASARAPAPETLVRAAEETRGGTASRRGTSARNGGVCAPLHRDTGTGTGTGTGTRRGRFRWLRRDPRSRGSL